MSRRVLISIALILLVAAVFDIGLYVSHFKSNELSTDPMHWGQFGDYIGGTLNPLLSFGAFVGVLFTIYLQDKQLGHTKQQAVIEELQRLAASASKGLDEQLQQRISRPQPNQVEHDRPSLWLAISGLGTAALSDAAVFGHLRDRVVSDGKLEIDIFLIDLQQLAWILNEYERAGGAAAVVAFYRKRYEVPVCWLHAASLLEGHRNVFDYFRPDLLVPLLKRGNA